MVQMQEEIKVKAVKTDNPKPNQWKERRRSLILNHEVSRFRRVFQENFITLIVSALGLVAALTWNDAVKTTIETLIPAQANLVYKYYAAIVVTIIAVTITYFLSKLKPSKP